jgi:protein-S-isoprenylcysteine O-methyltransferase Ste14
VSLLAKMGSKLLRFAGYFVPLIQSLPPLGIWTGLMTLPLASYLLMMLTNLPTSLPTALAEFFIPFLIPEKVTVVIGLAILVYSARHLELNKKEGLVTSGPYGLVRHPQYLGIVLSTVGFTSWCVWILSHTFGIGFLNSSQTIGVWFVELLAYVALALIEELHLSKKHGDAYKKYADHVSFLIPFLNTKRRPLDALLSIIIPSILLAILLSIQL